jgi:hypothetical protein
MVVTKRSKAKEAATVVRMSVEERDNIREHAKKKGFFQQIKTEEADASAYVMSLITADLAKSDMAGLSSKGATLEEIRELRTELDSTKNKLKQRLDMFEPEKRQLFAEVLDSFQQQIERLAEIEGR